jgi:hypothetical protein
MPKLLSRVLRAKRLIMIGRLMPAVVHKQNNLYGPMIGYCQLALDELADDHPARQDIVSARAVALEAAAYATAIMAIYRQLENEQRVIEQRIIAHRYAIRRVIQLV